LALASHSALWTVYLARHWETSHYELRKALFTSQHLTCLVYIYLSKELLYIDYREYLLTFPSTLALLERHVEPRQTLRNQLVGVLFAVGALSRLTDQFHAHFTIGCLVDAYLLEGSHYELLELLEHIGVLYVYHTTVALALLLCVVASPAPNTMRHSSQV
jgi:hypothetical protein